MFFIIYLVVSLSCILITSRTLVAYGDYNSFTKILIYTLFTIAWFSPIAIWSLQSKGLLPLNVYNIFAKTGYFLFGFAFILVMLILLRDIVWGAVYYLSGKQIISPTDSGALKIVNLITLFIALLFSIYSVYSAEKLPKVLNYKYSDSRIQKDMKILMISDTHINKMYSMEKLKKFVKYVNSLKPDVLLMVGDITDDKLSDIKNKVKELGKLEAPLGIYYVLGNHETYFDAFTWEAEFASLGWQVLHNSGVSIKDTGLYIAGLPDNRRFPINIKQALSRANDEEFRIILSHIPDIAHKIAENKVDLQVSGHTHGGQIFPFNFISKSANKGFLAGEYTLGNTKVLVSRGAGYWGPPMRLFAPNDIIMINLMPLEQKTEEN